MNQELQLFVRESLAKDQSREAIAEALKKGGWPQDEIDSALAAYADVAFPVAVPKRKPYLSAKEAFLYLVLFMTLYISAISLGTILFQFINRAFPDAIYSYGYDGTASIIRGALSAMIIAFPVFLGVSSVLRKAILKNPEKRSSKIRKWLTYVTLFGATTTIIVDLITILTSLLGGELTARFFLKALTVLVIAGSIFGYYLWDLRSEEKEVD
ncbi:MAG: hypothetical protein KC582_03630 [Candidatus Magasanikbacteria bacterium]|nr:hypothetical protein [Candidatus Magasanikbacteria bacterium]MCA9389446.1 hypothetical protein [Candidatus Magasanikbacteria bacterium]MCA9391320.1 hypothetical protein [Candidatus Magasanikbacteria bacterium]USN52729.1 MAG: hypothetical protein H6759_01485 [Candidatus Nomurabacteria bacterium]